jgi:hypothetical protein
MTTEKGRRVPRQTRTLTITAAGLLPLSAFTFGVESGTAVFVADVVAADVHDSGLDDADRVPAGVGSFDSDPPELVEVVTRPGGSSQVVVASLVAVVPGAGN